MFDQHAVLVVVAAVPPPRPRLMRAIRLTRSLLKPHNHSSGEAVPRLDYSPATTLCDSPSMVRHTPSRSTSSRIHAAFPRLPTIPLQPTRSNRRRQPITSHSIL